MGCQQKFSLFFYTINCGPPTALACETSARIIEVVQ